MAAERHRGRWGVLLLGFVLASCQPESIAHTVSGIVLDGDEPVAGAVVRIQTTETHTLTGADGRFTLTGVGPASPLTVTAWAAGYFIAGVPDVSPGADDVEIRLQAHPASDDSSYAWLPSRPHPGEGEDMSCARCHSVAGTDLPYSLPVDEWSLDAHSQSALNSRFLTMYRGTDTNGRRSPPTRFGYAKDYGSFPLLPDPALPYFGPGYKLDFVDTAGNCAACHLPAAAIDDPYGVDPSSVEGIAAEGVPCDFCHKVWDVRINPATGLPNPNAPGVLSFRFLRPSGEHQFFAGPLDDVAPGEDTYAPVQRESRFCAPCHFGVFWDTVVYNSFGEWSASPYSDPESGRTCQDCHMPPLGETHFARPDKGGLARNPETIFSHRMPGASDSDLLQNAVNLSASADRQGSQLIVRVEILNDQTGHHVPTDSPLRQMILLVEARDAAGEALVQMAGPTVPLWGGIGNPEDGYYAGLPGQGYARILGEIWTGTNPTGAYWNPTRVIGDNRLAALARDATTYTFAVQEDAAASEIMVHIRLIFRRAFRELVDQKGWDVPDISMEEIRLVVP